jgi:ligand-binding sensor domain-containing protein
MGVLIPDGAGGIRCGTDGAGLYHLERTGNAGRSPDADQWSIRSVHIGVPANISAGMIVEALLRNTSGDLWIASVSGLYRRFSDGHSERYTVRDGLQHDHVLSLLQDRRGVVWAGTWDGVCRISV